VFEAAHKSFWTRSALHRFLRRCHVAESFLATWTQDESKRDFLYRLFPLLEKNSKGPSVIKEMARHLADQTSFPDLEKWEDAAEKKEAATKAVAALKKYLQKQKQDDEDERQRIEAASGFRNSARNPPNGRSTWKNLMTAWRR
jgi:DNA phosphorothioation-dependent restriction protein DptG